MINFLFCAKASKGWETKVVNPQSARTKRLEIRVETFTVLSIHTHTHTQDVGNSRQGCNGASVMHNTPAGSLFFIKLVTLPLINLSLLLTQR